ncbi:hypothetical protein DPMN_000774 [Dreissena polymorpha]|uniref:Uncharacterized protein n=1 Tax=Dreissena polymorpha TaxID=45954 RepID=A0A9D4MG09_DREPO|nr:hypothetical protein DPMN_000774 [Dreissena polymorpha]
MPISSSKELQGHLINLFERSTLGRSHQEALQIASLLIKHSDTFLNDDWDLGLTQLAEHVINTDNAAPVRQRPRRVPLAEEEKQAIEDLM